MIWLTNFYDKKRFLVNPNQIINAMTVQREKGDRYTKIKMALHSTGDDYLFVVETLEEVYKQIDNFNYMKANYSEKS